jgi:hypothetical protein
MNHNPAPRQTLADIILEKITEKQTELQTQFSDAGSECLFILRLHINVYKDYYNVLLQNKLTIQRRKMLCHPVDFSCSLFFQYDNYKMCQTFMYNGNDMSVLSLLYSYKFLQNLILGNVHKKFSGKFNFGSLSVQYNLHFL